MKPHNKILRKDLVFTSKIAESVKAEKIEKKTGLKNIFRGSTEVGYVAVKFLHLQRKSNFKQLVAHKSETVEQWLSTEAITPSKGHFGDINQGATNA